MGDNASGADNQQETKSASRRRVGSSETTRRAPLTKGEIVAYLNGAAHDATLNKRRRVRFAQKYREWLETIAHLLTDINYRSWIYKEGTNRNVFVLETVCPEIRFNFNPSLLGQRQKAAYLGGFFDAEGGVPRNGKRFYIQLSQKDKAKMRMIKTMLEGMEVQCGKIHNPSRRVDPNYWRIFVRAKSHKAFAQQIQSYHPIKSVILRERMKI